ncbi:hypothetical protein ACFLV2_03715, partial [Chloroflexota bacterium]
HSLLLVPVRRGNERLPKNKLRILSCDAEGNVFTQLIGRTTHQRIFTEAENKGLSGKSYAAIYWDNGTSRYRLLLVEISNQETWALERILEHALRNAVIPDVLKGYPKQIIGLGENILQADNDNRRREKPDIPETASSKVLNRLPYYRPQDIEVSIPIYKANYTFPLIVLKRLPPEENTLPSQQRLLILDSDGDMTVTVLPLGQIKKADIKLNELQAEGKAGCLVGLKGREGVIIDVIPLSEAQRRALDTLTQYFQGKGKGKQHLSAAVKKVLSKARETVSN